MLHVAAQSKPWPMLSAMTGSQKEGLTSWSTGSPGSKPWLSQLHAMLIPSTLDFTFSSMATALNTAQITLHLSRLFYAIPQFSKMQCKTLVHTLDANGKTER